jgi:hypothetical protein
MDVVENHIITLRFRSWKLEHIKIQMDAGIGELRFQIGFNFLEMMCRVTPPHPTNWQQHREFPGNYVPRDPSPPNKLRVWNHINLDPINCVSTPANPNERHDQALPYLRPIADLMSENWRTEAKLRKVRAEGRGLTIFGELEEVAGLVEELGGVLVLVAEEAPAG